MKDEIINVISYIDDEGKGHKVLHSFFCIPVSVMKERIDRYLQMLENRHYNILEHKLQHDLEELDSKVRK